MRTIIVPFLALAVGIGGAVVSACDSSDAPETQPTSSSSSGGSGTGASNAGGSGANGATGGGASGSGAGGPGGAGGMPGGDTCAIVPPGTGGGASSGLVRVVAANLTSGNKQSYDGGQGVRILQGLDADVILLQEMNYGANTDAAIGALVDDVCSGECSYIRGPQEQIPNGVLSRLPMLECGSWTDPEVSNRNFVWARIDVPGSADLWAISVHLLTSNSSNRALEAAALLSEIAAAIPPTDLIVLGGDLNTNNRAESAITAFASVFQTAGPHPVDQNGNDSTNAPRDKPYDWVLADADLAAQQVPLTIGQSVFPAGAVIDTRVYTPLSEIAPALSGDSGAPSMQHMAVVKDFQIE